MQNDLDLTGLDLSTAMHIAHARAHAIRAQETRAFFRAIAKSVRGLFFSLSALVAHKNRAA